MPTRRRFLAVLSAAALLAPRGVRSAEPSAPAAKGRRFLAGLIDPDLDLLPEFRGSETYWLYHDNYLAAKVLRPTEPRLADRIEAAVRGFGVTGSGKIEIVAGEAEDPLPFRHHRLDEVARRGRKVVKTEVVTGRRFEGWQEYADLLFLAAIAQSKSDATAATSSFDAGRATWDGKGFADQAMKANGLYATYKLALASIVASALGRPFDIGPAVRERLVAMQAEDGGWVTDYRDNLKPTGFANVETTSLAILALEGAK